MRMRSHFGVNSEIDFRRLNKSLHVNSSTDDMIVGREVAYRLHEEKTRLFGHVVRVLGKRTTSDIFAETKEIVNKGGLKTDKGDRMRTPGGTFLYLMKSRGYATPEQVKEIFAEDNAGKKKAKKRQRDAEFVKFCVYEDLRKEQGDPDGQPRPKKKKKKAKSKSKENTDDGSVDKSSQESKSLEKDLSEPVVSSGANNTNNNNNNNNTNNSAANTSVHTAPTEGSDDDEEPIREEKPAVNKLPSLEEHLLMTGDLEEGEID